MGLANLIETSGGIGGVYGAGVRHGIVQRGLADEIGARVSYSVGGYNSMLEASGLLQEAPQHYLRVARELINKPGAFMQYIEKLDERDPLKIIASLLINHPHWISYSIGKIPNKFIRDKFSSFTKQLTDTYEAIVAEFKQKEKDPIVNMHCLDEIISDVITPDREDRLRTFPHPVFMAAYNLKEARVDFLDARVHTIAALKATSSIVGYQRVNNERYTDAAFHAPINYTALPEGVKVKPRIIVRNQGKHSWLGINEAKYFFVAQWDLDAYRQYIQFQGQESSVFKQLGKDPSVLILRPSTPIGFSTSKPEVIDRAWEEGIRDAVKVEKFLDKIASKKLIAAA